MEITDSQVKEISSEWFTFLKKSSRFTLLENDSIRVTTPFADSFGDGIVINLRMIEGEYLLSDQGYTIWNLTTNGVDVLKKNSNRFRMLKSLLTSYSFSLSGKHAIERRVQRKDLSQAITDMAQVLINVSDLAFLSRNNTAAIFYDDVKDYFNQNRDEYSFLRTIYADGKSFAKYRFEYVFTPQANVFKLTKLYSTLTKSTMDIIIGIWSDTQSFRDENYGSNASMNILLDGMTAKEKEYADGLQQHGINVIDFAQKESVRESFATIPA